MKKISLSFVSLFVFLSLCLFSFSAETPAPTKPAFQLTVQEEPQTALYKVGEKAVFKVGVDGVIPPDFKVHYAVQQGNQEKPSEEGDFTFTTETPTLTVEHLWEKPGFALLKITSPLLGDKPSLGGAGCEPEKIQPSLPKPSDFDSFWDEQKKSWDALPLEEVLTPVATTIPNIEVYSITMNNIQGSKIHGFFAKPKGAGPFPIVMCVNYAGIYSLNPNLVSNFASRGAISMDINPHDIENGQPPEYYKELGQKALLDWSHQGRESRETSYFLRMFSSCYRGGKYLTSRPEWNQKQFIVQGSSMGGGQSIVSAYLCPQITAFASNVPALCDHAGPVAGRLAGWPRWCAVKEGALDPKQLEASRYYDTVNFAYTIKAKALISNGFIDTTCPPSSVYAAFNVLAGEIEMMNLPLSGHEVKPEWTKKWNEFITAEAGLKP
ncbi:MAG: acetylxylan esterase [Verrucomicrobiota bacterium]